MLILDFTDRIVLALCFLDYTKKVHSITKTNDSDDAFC
jgi:hypothetical protein